MPPKEPLSCPFCPFADDDELFLIQHVETVHPENGESPFVIMDSPRQEQQDKPQPDQGKSDGDEDEDDYIECMCGEFCLSNDFDSHLEMHSAEGTVFDDLDRTTIQNVPPLTLSRGDVSSSEADTPPRTPPQDAVSLNGKPIPIETLMLADPSSSSRHDDRSYAEIGRVSTSPSKHHKRKASGNSKPRRPTQRLGKAELGPHADEEQMPDWLRKMLEKGAKITVWNQIGQDGRLLRIESVANECRRIMPVIGRLCSQDDAIAKAYLCHSDVTHVVKMSKEGGFCGYRNIQMMISYIQDTRSQGYELFQGRIPSILQLQDMIEEAWDMGFCTIGRIETGGIRGTRKYIGTPEAQALFESLQISCRAETFHDSGDLPAHQHLLLAIEEYFRRGTTEISKKICKTSLPPLYLQHPGHSLTIVGFERRKSGACNLLVFDPMFQPSPAIRRFIGTRFHTSHPEKLLKAYRRGESLLRKYKTFEILKLASSTSSQTAWTGL